MTLHTQLITMIAMIIGGIYLGFATETYRRILYKWRDYSIVRYGFEILYWIVQTAVLFYILYRMNHGEVRLFFALACLLGFSMYIVLCKPWYVRLLEMVIKLIKTLIYWTSQCIYKLIIQPLIWLVRLIIGIMLFIYRVLIKVLYILCYPVLFLLKKYLPEKVLKNISKLPTICSTIKDKLIEHWKRLSKKWR